MTAVAGQFVKFDAVPTRKVVRVTIEVPIEKADETLKNLGGFPDPSNAKWLGLALLKGQPAENTMKGGRLAQKAGILCNEGGFQRFCDASNADEAAEYIYQRCNVSSRAHLDHDDDAARAFRDIETEYRVWLNGVAA
jgi:hypothetical protein